MLYPNFVAIKTSQTNLNTMYGIQTVVRVYIQYIQSKNHHKIIQWLSSMTSGESSLLYYLCTYNDVFLCLLDKVKPGVATRIRQPKV